MTHHDLLPLISSRSPSYSRAMAQLGQSFDDADAIAVGKLNRLVEAENDAWEVCRHIAQCCEHDVLRDLALQLADTHIQRQEVLHLLVTRLGGSPPESDECRSVLLHGPKYFQGLHDPGEIYASLREMYAELGREYQRTKSIELPSRVRIVLGVLMPRPSL